MADPGVEARRLAIDALVRIDDGGAFANLVVGPLLERSDLEDRDRRFVTELVYGTTRMRRACDWLVERFLIREVDGRVRAALRIGAYQLVFLHTPPHAAVDATVAALGGRAKGLVNAVLRKVAKADNTWPDEATRLSYPDWIIERLSADLGPRDALAALEKMNEAASATERADGYVQDEASQWIAELTGGGERVLDLCAAPGGKTTALATVTDGLVVGADLRRSRVKLVVENAKRLGLDNVAVVIGDGTATPFRPGSFDRVLVDAPCSGLGALRRRADARWRIQPDGVERLAALQHRLVDAAAELVAPDGVLVYSVCTLTNAESLAIDDRLARSRPGWIPLDPPGAPWQPHGRGARLLPQAADTDGMIVLRLRRPDL